LYQSTLGLGVIKTKKKIPGGMKSALRAGEAALREGERDYRLRALGADGRPVGPRFPLEKTSDALSQTMEDD